MLKRFKFYIINVLFEFYVIKDQFPIYMRIKLSFVAQNLQKWKSISKIIYIDSNKFNELLSAIMLTINQLD